MFRQLSSFTWSKAMAYDWTAGLSLHLEGACPLKGAPSQLITGPTSFVRALRRRVSSRCQGMLDCLGKWQHA